MWVTGGNAISGAVGMRSENAVEVRLEVGLELLLAGAGLQIA